jgi:hypothetical protein
MATGGEWEVQVDFEQVGGRLYPSRLELGPGVFEDGMPVGGITARLLHRLKLGQLVNEFRAEHQGNIAAEALFFGRTPTVGYALPPPSNRPGPRGIDEVFYQDVARRYLQAVRTDPRRPIAVMARDFPDYTKNNVRDWVARSRQKGYLPAPGQGRAGGESTPKLDEALLARGPDGRKGGNRRRIRSRGKRS